MRICAAVIPVTCMSKPLLPMMEAWINAMKYFMFVCSIHCTVCSCVGIAAKAGWQR